VNKSSCWMKWRSVCLEECKSVKNRFEDFLDDGHRVLVSQDVLSRAENHCGKVFC